MWDYDYSPGSNSHRAAWATVGGLTGIDQRLLRRCPITWCAWSSHRRPWLVMLWVAPARAIPVNSILRAGQMLNGSTCGRDVLHGDGQLRCGDGRGADGCDAVGGTHRDGRVAVRIADRSLAFGTAPYIIRSKCRRRHGPDDLGVQISLVVVPVRH